MANINHLALLILGFDESHFPTRDELAQAFRSASLKFHPDMGGSAQLFRALTMAKEVVLDILPGEAKPYQSSTDSSYNESNESKCDRQRAEILHQAEMATINLSKSWRRIKTITLSTEDYGTLFIHCHHMWDVKNVQLAKQFHNNYEVLKMYADALRWISDKPRRKYKQAARYTLNGKEITIQFSYKYEGIMNWLIP